MSIEQLIDEAIYEEGSGGNGADARNQAFEELDQLRELCREQHEILKGLSFYGDKTRDRANAAIAKYEALTK